MLRTTALAAAVLLVQAARPSRDSFTKPKSKYPQSYHVALTASPKGFCDVTKHEWGQVNKAALSAVVVTEIPAWHECDEDGEGEAKDMFMNFYGPDPDAVWGSVESICKLGANTTNANSVYTKDNAEIRLLAGNGDSDNRIDVVFMGDGYTAAEEAKFFADMQRLTQDMFRDVTFETWLPVFNIWALFIPSTESGIGTHGRPRNTHYGLYRDGTELRGIYPAYPNNARAACRLAPGCDFPSIIGNDEFYGGLGGEFVIGTQSLTTGTIVLRHEMGHNFVNVGEEYDDGQVYRGVNSDNTLTNVKWSHWLTEPQTTIPEQKAIKLLGEYPWVDLGNGNQSFTFTSDGSYSRWYLRFTLSGCDTENSIAVTLDGQELAWTPALPLGEPTVDRQFYVYQDMQNGFSAGQHTLSFAQLIPPAAGRPARQLCSLSLHQYGNENEFKWDDKDYVGAYPTWSVRNVKTYRPQNEICLMRNMSSPHFCKACTEGMWWQFFRRMSAIDDIEVQTVAQTTHVTAHVVPLGQFREVPIPGLGDKYDIEWTHNGVAQPDLSGFFEWNRFTSSAQGTWVATVIYVTPEVRTDLDILTFTHTITI